jgi:predicted restriction endonuclease
MKSPDGLLGLWTIDDNFRIVGALTITSEECRKYHDTVIRLPKIISHYPSLKTIKWHRSKVFRHLEV